jgi:hypothetical protein
MNLLSLLPRSTTRPARSFSALRRAARITPIVAASMVVLGGCAAFDLTEVMPNGTGADQHDASGSLNEEEAGTTRNDVNSAYPALPTYAAEMPEESYPGYPSPARRIPPRPTPRPKPDYADALPLGAVPRPSTARGWTPAGDDGRLVTVQYTIDGRAELALLRVAEDATLKLLWDTSRYDDSPRPIVDAISLYDRLMIVGEDDVALIELDVDADGATVVSDYRLGIAPDSARDIRPEIVSVDLDADGTTESVIVIPDYRTKSGDQHTSSGVTALYERGDTPRMRQIARLEPHAQIMDRDLDGAAEILRPAGDGGWHVQLYDGTTIVDAAPVDAEQAEPSQVAADGELPALPADLYFYRDGGIHLWPGAGGALQTVWPQDDSISGHDEDRSPQVGAANRQQETSNRVPTVASRQQEPVDLATEAVSGHDEVADDKADWRTMDPTARDDWYAHKVFEVANDGSVAVLVEKASDPDGDVEHRFRVVDLHSGASRTVPMRGMLRLHGMPMSWDITPDGRWLVYLGYDAADESMCDQDQEFGHLAAATATTVPRYLHAHAAAVVAVDLVV